MPEPSGYVIEAVIRVPDETTAEWVVLQIAALLADRTDGARLDRAGIFEASAWEAAQCLSDDELEARWAALAEGV